MNVFGHLELTVHVKNVGLDGECEEWNMTGCADIGKSAPW